MKNLLLLTFIFVGLWGHNSFAEISSPLNGKSVRICEDQAEWPPIIFHKRESGNKVKPLTADGISVDIIDAIFEMYGLNHPPIQLLPWQRILLDLEKNNKTCDMVIEGTFSQKRLEKFLLTNSYISLNGNYFYSKNKYPSGLIIKDYTELVKYKICGIHGWNYSVFQVPNWEKIIDRGSKNIPALMRKLHLGRCDVFLSRIEIFAGFAITEKNYLSDKNLRYSPVLGIKIDPVHMMISRKYEHAYTLKGIIDDGLKKLKESKKLEEILDKYIPRR